MFRNLKTLLLIAAVALVCAALGLWFWRKNVVAKRSVISTQVIEQSILVGDFVSARSALTGLADPVAREAKEKEVRVAELKQAMTVRDTSLMRTAIGEEGEKWIDPKLLEAADLELAREAIQSQSFENYAKFAAKWQGKSAIPGQWVLLEADQLLAKKQPEEAFKLLKSAQLTGSEDALRQARLALLEAKEPWKAMNSIDAGLKSDPRNADLLSFRAQIEEAAGRTADARLDYVAAVLSERKNPIHREILANFYLRNGDRAAAAETWRDAAEDTGLGVYALKSWFWSRVTGVALSKPIPQIRQEGWRQFIAALTALPENQFWNGDLEPPLAVVHGGSKRPEVMWLRLLQSLREQDVKAAKAQLDTGFSKEAEAMMPGLSLRLLVHLTARDGKDPRLALAGREKLPAVSADAHPLINAFFQWANRSSSDQDNMRFEAWLAKPIAPVGTFIAVGWAGAATIIGDGDKLVLDPDAPDWFDYGYSKALYVHNGKEAARKWLEAVPNRTVAADLFLGELRLTSGSVDQGLELLQKVAASKSPQASRASWTLALAELDRGNIAKAREITQADAALAGSTQGKEILARAALADGKKDETLKIYQELGEQSVDAMIYLSKEAFAAKDFAKARALTETLARRFPEQPSFRENLLKIAEAEKAAKP